MQYQYKRAGKNILNNQGLLSNHFDNREPVIGSHSLQNAMYMVFHSLLGQM
jgi:hypothetical protein